MRRTRRPPLTEPVADHFSCDYCHSGLRHELFRFTLSMPEGAWSICPRCIPAVLARLERAHADVGDLLESMWDWSAEE